MSVIPFAIMSVRRVRVGGKGMKGKIRESLTFFGSVLAWD